MVLVTVLFSACYSFKGTDIDYTKTKTFSVSVFQNAASAAPAATNIQFTEQLKDKIRNDTRLRYTTIGGDLEFSGSITKYQITALAPKPGETTALQQLEIGINVKCYNVKDEDKSWEQTFSYPAQFASGQDLSSVQDALINEAFTNILENIFNKAFTNW